MDMLLKDTISLTSILEQLPRGLIQSSAAEGVPKDRLSVGWRVENGSELSVVIGPVTAVTPEAAVTLSALVAAVRHTRGSAASVRIDPLAIDDSTSRAWIKAVLLNQLVLDDWNHQPSITPTTINSCTVSPLWRMSLKSGGDCNIRATFLAGSLAQHLVPVRTEDVEHLLIAVSNALREALRNTLEHGHDAPGVCNAYAHMMVAPVQYWASVAATDIASEAEREWLREFPPETPVLELAIADAGKGIPSTLHSAYATHAQRQRSASRERVQDSRQSAQTEICKWALDYRSTRKRISDFPTRAAQLNWRGLHRTLNAVARVGGTLLIRSGSTRVGTAFINGSAREIASAWERASDLPGTALVVRVPLLSDQQPLKGRSAGSLSSVVKRNLVLRPKVVAAPDLPTDSTAHRAKWLAIVHSFDSLSDTVALVPIVYALPPSGISVHLFVEFSTPAGSGDLQAFTSAAEAAAFGVPRLVGLRKGSAIRWLFAGLMPDGLRAAIDELESTGIVRPNWDDDVARDFFRELLSAYPSAVKRDSEFVHLAVFGARLGTDVFLAALQLAFDNWTIHNIGPCIFERPSVVVRTPKGRLVRRYLPLLRILYANEALSEAIGECLGRLLELEARKHGSVLVVADSEASYFVARLLLSTDHPHIRIYLRRPPLDPAGAAIVIFSDVVWKGEALKALVDDVKPTRIVIALDLSPDLHSHGFSKVSCLLRYPFDPRELATPVADMSIVEVDKVTHLPAPPLYADATSFGFEPTQGEFARTHPDVFINGIQTRGGRVHTLAVSSKRLVEVYSSEVLAWVMRTIEDILPKTPDSDIVISTRAEAHVSRLVPMVAEQVVRAAAPGSRVFHVSIPFAASASHEVFARPTSDPWDGATEVRARWLLPNELRKHPLVIFLDDACVTGRTLRQFLLRVAGAAHDATPSSVLLLPIVSRFAIDEELFFGALCRDITSLDGTRQVLVFFRPCLRLFVRSYDRVETLHAYRLLIKAQRQLAGLDERLERFVDRALGRLREAVSTTTDADTAANGHPFYPASAVSDGRGTSARAVRIRHLLSLHEANVGVLGQALTEIMAASAEEDWSFLSVLATEPDLLDLRPLKGQCEHDIKSLAISALTHGAPPTVQSDAIAVLAAQGMLVGTLSTVVPAILSNTDLVDECVALLAATATAPARTWRALLEAATNSQTASLQTDAGGRADEAAYLMGVARSLLLVEHTIATQQTESDYTARVQRYIADTSYHGPTVRAMAAVTNFLESSDSTRKLRPGRHVKTLVGNFCTAGTSVLVAGLLGFSSLAHSKNHPAAHRDLRMAALRLSTALTELNALLESVAEFDGATIHRLTTLWKRIQDCSQRSPTEFILSHANLSDRDSTPAERWLPEFFCLPIETIGNMAKETVEGLKVTSGPIAEGRQFSVIVAPVPLNDVRRIADLLLLDVQRHGLDKSSSVEFELKAAEGVPCLEVTIRDVVREGDIPGRHRSQGQVTDIAHRNGVHYFHDPPRSPGELFASRLVFPNVWYLEG